MLERGDVDEHKSYRKFIQAICFQRKILEQKKQREEAQKVRNVEMISFEWAEMF